MEKYLSIIIKTTWDCNMRCNYCYEQSNQYANTKIPIDTVYNLLQKISENAEDAEIYLKIIWHGGEPLTMGLDFYKKIIELEKGFTNLRITNAIQTNGTLINDNWIDFLNKHDFKVGVSLDGPSVIHDMQRLFIGNESSFNEVWSAYRVLKEKRNGTGLIAVVTQNTINHKEDFYTFFRQNRLDVKLSPLIPVKGRLIHQITDKIGITPGEYGEFLAFLFHKWISEDEYLFQIDPLFDMIRSFITGSPKTCIFVGKCGNFLSLEPNGNVTICGRWSSSDIFLGNINVNSLQELYRNVKLFLEERAKVENSCSSCRYFQICHGGCSYLAFAKRGVLSDCDYYCESYKRIFRDIEIFLKNEGVLTKITTM